MDYRFRFLWNRWQNIWKVFVEWLTNRWSRPTIEQSTLLCNGNHDSKAFQSKKENHRLSEIAMKLKSKEELTALIEGNTGAGKFTFLDYFGNESQMDVVFEPVPKWQNLRGINLMELMGFYI